MDEFKSIFDNVGTLIQPTKDNKPNSTVWIKTLTKDEISTVFGDLLSKISGQVYSEPRSFQKQAKLGKSNLDFSAANINYSSNTQQLKIKFDCINQDSGSKVGNTRMFGYFL
jgi:hypothetical protein